MSLLSMNNKQGLSPNTVVKILIRTTEDDEEILKFKFFVNNLNFKISSSSSFCKYLYVNTKFFVNTYQCCSVCEVFHI